VGYFHLSVGFVAGFTLGGLVLVLHRGAVLTFFLALPGIFAHELSHWTVAFVLRSSPHAFRLFPKKESSGDWVLGSVNFEPHWWSAGFVALAPGYLVPLMAWLIYSHVIWLNFWGQVVAGYVVIALLWSAFPSSQDWKIALRYPIGTFAVLSLFMWWLRAVLSLKI
jgi:hypothetical protein